MRIFNKKSVLEKRRKLRNKMTEEEVILWSFIKNKKLKGIKFRRQYSIGPYIVDFFANDYNLAIELDGSGHFEEEQMIYDQQRTNYLNSLGIKVIRITNGDIRKNLAGVLEYIEDVLKGSKITTPSLRDTPPYQGGEIKS